MINLNDEKSRNLSTQEVYDIVDMSIQMAEDGGFINDFVLQRALILNTMLVLNINDCKEEYAAKVSDNPLLAWDELINNGLVETTVNDFGKDFKYVCEAAEEWVEDYTQFLNSARGLLSTFSNTSNTVLQEASKQLQELTDSSEVKETLEIANKWGMSNTGELYQN